MTERLQQHYPTSARDNTPESMESQRIYDLRTVQDNVALVLDEIADKAHLDSFLLEGITVSTTETLVQHKLGRKVRGWHIVRKNGYADVKDNIDDTTADLNKFLPLLAESEVTISLVVF